MSKKDELRAHRAKSKKQTMTLVIILVAFVAVIIAALIIVPQIISNNKPVADVIVPAANPRPQANGLNMGDPNAPVKIVEYADFQCPACQAFVTNIEPTIVDKYVKTGKAYYSFHPDSFIDNFVPNGNESKASAQAAYCASDQGKFWEFHDVVYANQDPTGENKGAMSDKRLSLMAEKLHLDMTAFNSCYSSGKYKQQVLDDKTSADSIGVDQTPSLSINGKLVVAKDFNDMLAQIDAAVTAAGK